jgi:natural product biosynthesis luciferase-like monooxygenase protein
MQFGLMFFSSSDTGTVEDKYALLREAARFADTHGFCCIWTPERHFHPFGGLYPNPALTTCALAMITERISLRAGSLIGPLHDAIRIAEEWSVADNLSSGRVAVSFGSGWNAADFVFFPERYERRQAFMYEQIDLVQRLWRGETVSRPDSFGRTVQVELHPRPVQMNLPVWITSSGSQDTFEKAGAIGANVLTHLLGQDVCTLAARIALYRRARLEHGFDPDTGIVSLMLHTFLGRDLETVREQVRLPFQEYLRSSLTLERKSAEAGGAASGNKRNVNAVIDPQDQLELLEIAFERYFDCASLMGTPESRRGLLVDVEEIGVNEIACLIDFGLNVSEVIRGLDLLSELAAMYRAEVV